MPFRQADSVSQTGGIPRPFPHRRPPALPLPGLRPPQFRMRTAVPETPLRNGRKDTLLRTGRHFFLTLPHPLPKQIFHQSKADSGRTAPKRSSAEIHSLPVHPAPYHCCPLLPFCTDNPHTHMPVHNFPIHHTLQAVPSQDSPQNPMTGAKDTADYLKRKLHHRIPLLIPLSQEPAAPHQCRTVFYLWPQCRPFVPGCL